MKKELIKANQTKNNEIVNQNIDSITELKNSIIKEKIPKNKNSNKIITTIQKIVHFNN